MKLSELHLLSAPKLKTDLSSRRVTPPEEFSSLFSERRDFGLRYAPLSVRAASMNVRLFRLMEEDRGEFFSPVGVTMVSKTRLLIALGENLGSHTLSQTFTKELKFGRGSPVFKTQRHYNFFSREFLGELILQCFTVWAPAYQAALGQPVPTDRESFQECLREWSAKGEFNNRLAVAFFSEVPHEF